MIEHSKEIFSEQRKRDIMVYLTRAGGDDDLWWIILNSPSRPPTKGTTEEKFKKRTRAETRGNIMGKMAVIVKTAPAHRVS
jgi:hypothetical protein